MPIQRIHSFILLFLFTSIAAHSLDFAPEVRITGDSEYVEFTRNPQGQAEVDSEGNLHFVYTVREMNTAPVSTHVIYRRMTNGLIGNPLQVDYGDSAWGREASLTLDERNHVHVVWHDLRHSTAAAQFIDNIEIYYARQTERESFSETNLRLTQTQADHRGDNGYVPQIRYTPDGRLHVIWYDFHKNGSNAEIYLMSSDDQGNFTTATDIVQHRIASVESGENAALWLPSLAHDALRDLHAVWGRRVGYTGVFALETRVIATDGSLGDIETLTSAGGTFLDPPRMAQDLSGNIGLVYVKPENTFDFRIAMQYKPNGEAWSEPFFIDEGDSGVSQPDIAFDAQGLVYAVWLDDREGYPAVWLAIADPVAQQTLSSQRISGENAFPDKPIITISPVDQRVHILWLDTRDPNTQQVYYIREVGTQIRNWEQH